MKAQINQLLKILRGMYLMLWILPILLCVLYETGTVRDRDTMKQDRVNITQLRDYLEEKIGF